MAQPKQKTEGLLTLSTLLSLIDEGVIKWWNSQHADEPNKKIEMYPFKSDHVKDLSGTAEQRETNRIITYRKIRLAPGTMGNAPFSGTKERRPRKRETVVDVSDSGQPTATQVYGRWIDTLVRFDCYGPSWSEASELESDFIRLMTMFTGYIMKNGINKMTFEGSYSDAYQVQTDYFYEPVTYYFRLEELFTRDDRVIQQFDLNMNNVYQRIIRN
jgi:hypothetical protein